MSKLSAVSQDSARAGLCGEQVRSRRICERFDLPDFIMDFTSLMPSRRSRWRGQFRCRGSRRESAVALLSLAEKSCAMNRPENLAVAIAWYRAEQWALLRAVSADGGKLEATYDEWLAFATQQVRDLEARGIRVQKVVVEVGALTR